MKSLYVRILLALLGTVLLSLVAFLGTFFAMTRPAQERLIRHFQARTIEDAVAVYQRDGAAGVSKYLDDLNRSLGATHYLLDASGRDVVSGSDRSALLRVPRRLLGGPAEIDGRLIVVFPSADGRYRLLIAAPPPFNMGAFIPYYLSILAAMALLCWLLARAIVAPLRELGAAVDRFGRGALTTRVPTGRRDEIGNLARAFNQMAERIETLLTAQHRLLQDISHELRSPLARLSIGIELARTAGDRDLALTRLDKEVARLSGLVASLLEVTRAEGDPFHRKAEFFRLQSVVDSVVRDCSVEADARRCRIVVAGRATRGLRGDPELIRRAFENVLRNAIRYAPAESTIALHIDEQPAETAVSVRDAGTGVPDAVLSKLAQPFFRVDDSRDSTTGGVGLGLSIAERALHLHHGSLAIENAHPGLRVTLTLPNEPEAASATV